MTFTAPSYTRNSSQKTQGIEDIQAEMIEEY